MCLSDHLCRDDLFRVNGFAFIVQLIDSLLLESTTSVLFTPLVVFILDSLSKSLLGFLAASIFLLAKFALASIDFVVVFLVWQFFTPTGETRVHLFSRRDYRLLRSSIKAVRYRCCDGACGVSDGRRDFAEPHRLQLKQVNEEIDDESDRGTDNTRVLHVHYVRVERPRTREGTGFDQIGNTRNE